PQRQMFPPIAASMSWSVGFLFVARSAAADMICPDWQYPHWGTSNSIQARWAGWSVRADRPSMAVICLPATADPGVTHERVGAPSTWTVHAPQRAIPHPYLVPVSPSVSRTTHRRGMSGETSNWRGVPFTVSETMAAPSAERLDPSPCYALR